MHSITHDRPYAHAEEYLACVSSCFCFFPRARYGSPSAVSSRCLESDENDGYGAPTLEVSRRVLPDPSCPVNAGESTLRSVGCEARTRWAFTLTFVIADKVLATLGEGTFGKVVKVKDLQM